MLSQKPKGLIPPTSTSCDHCKEPIEDHPIQLEDQVFCCTGCKMVFQILHDHGMDSFYKMDQQAGLNQRNKAQVDYSFLDNPEILDQLIDFKDEQRVKITLLLPDIHCSSCIWLLEHLDRLDKGVIQSRVHFLKKTLSLLIDPNTTSIRKVVDWLDRIGYPPRISLASQDEQVTNPGQRKLALQIGVAGFVFGNIMLLSFPDYLGLHESGFQGLFGVLNILLILPTVLYSGRDYWISAFTALKQKHLNIDVPIVLGIATLFIRSMYEIISRTGSGYLDSLAGLILFLLIGKWFQQKTYHFLSFERDYKSYFPLAVTQILPKGEQLQKSLDHLEVGDRILIRNQQIIPADAILVKGKGRIDYSFVSGESEAVRKVNGDKLFAGGRQIGGSIEVDIIKKVSQSYLTQLWNDVAFQKQEQGQASKLADRFGSWFTRIILLIASLTLTYWLVVDPSIAANATTAVLIIACPCAIALSIPFTFGNVLRILSRNGLFLKNTQALEAIQSLGFMVFDKTGTLTSTKKAEVRFIGEPLSEDQKVWIKSLTHQSSHPMSRQINEALGNKAIVIPENFQEFTGQGIEGIVAGKKILVGSAIFIHRKTGKDLLDVNQKKGVFIAIDGEILGYFNIEQSLRKQLKKILKSVQSKYSIFLLSGDSTREKHLFEPLFLEEHLFFNQSPTDKLAFIRQLQDSGEGVMMIGDGLNDAGALQQADVGLVITEDINNFTPACDGILEAKQFEKLPTYLRFVSDSRKLIYGAYALALIYNIIGLTYAVQGLLSPLIAAILMPLSSITIIGFGVLSSSILAHWHGIQKSDADHFQA